MALLCRRTSGRLGERAEVIGGFLMVCTITGILMALFMNNGGGAWDNAKKFIETGRMVGRNPNRTKLRLSEIPSAIRSKIPRSVIACLDKTARHLR